MDSSSLTAIVIGDPSPVLVYGTAEPKVDADGRQQFRVPVLLSGTGDRRDPTAQVVVPGPLPSLQKGQPVTFVGLTISTWTLRDGGRERSGVTLRASGVQPQVKR